MDVRVYAGPGASPRLVHSTLLSLARHLPQRQVRAAEPTRHHYIARFWQRQRAAVGCVQVSTISATELVDRGAWIDETAAIVMPGGADLPYCAALNGTGNANIRCVFHKCSAVTRHTQ